MSGRIDQRFCCDQCRNTYNNRLNRDETGDMQRVGRTLRKNRRILKELFSDWRNEAEIAELMTRGFDFRYFTSIRLTDGGMVCFFCFEYGYTPRENGYFALVKNESA